MSNDSKKSITITVEGAMGTGKSALAQFIYFALKKLNFTLGILDEAGHMDPVQRGRKMAHLQETVAITIRTKQTGRGSRKPVAKKPVVKSPVCRAPKGTFPPLPATLKRKSKPRP